MVSVRLSDKVTRWAPIVFSSLCVLAFGTGCAAELRPTSRSSNVEVVGSSLRLPDRNSGFDYQLGGSYTPPPGASVVVRDHTAHPAGVGYDICYVNGFQTQPMQSRAFASAHPDLVIHADGAPVVDEGWPDEYILDTSTEPKRAAIAAIAQPWIEGCKAAGYSGVEVDNVDSYTRSGGLLSVDDNLAMASRYVQIAHQAGLAIAQKNIAEQAQRLRRMGYDFAVVESCVVHRECGDYSAHYPVVLDIEYVDELRVDGFTAACRSADRPAAMIMRDHNLLTPSDGGYFYRDCAATGAR
ncbi:endo alpha-1,4 polygalactosaminidase [Mycobacterium sp. CBMA226]|nr:endo alpha-1,4 polygalactosaminidase [Mycolicibacterium sp. CBMA 226]